MFINYIPYYWYLFYLIWKSFRCLVFIISGYCFWNLSIGSGIVHVVTADLLSLFQKKVSICKFICLRGAKVSCLCVSGSSYLNIQAFKSIWSKCVPLLSNGFDHARFHADHVMKYFKNIKKYIINFVPNVF